MENDTERMDEGDGCSAFKLIITDEVYDFYEAMAHVRNKNIAEFIEDYLIRGMDESIAVIAKTREIMDS